MLYLLYPNSLYKIYLQVSFSYSVIMPNFKCHDCGAYFSSERDLCTHDITVHHPNYILESSLVGQQPNNHTGGPNVQHQPPNAAPQVRSFDLNQSPNVRPFDLNLPSTSK